jgi:hypothetical protein
MDEQRRKAFDFAQETTKQLLTLATGIFALTITFMKDIVKDDKGAKDVIEWLQIGWVLYITSVLFGVVALMALTGHLERAGGKMTTPTDKVSADKVPSIYAGNTRWASAAQVLTFMAALFCTFMFGAKAT